MTYLLDTNVVSELRRPQPDPAVLAWFGDVRSEDLHLSVLTIGEIRLGVERLRRRDAVRADVIERWLDGLVAAYRDRLVAVDVAVAQRWGQINVPDPLPVINGLLAATALVRGWTLVTRNTADVERSGVATLDPFSG